MAEFTNREIAKILREIAAAYEAKEESKFRIAAYLRAADNIEHATLETKDLWDEGKLQEIPGIGESIASYLDELFKTGKVSHFQKVKKGLPFGMFEILSVPGVGPKTAYKIARNLGAKNIDDLKKVCEEGRVRELEGFGEQSEKDIIKGIEEHERRLRRMLLSYADAVAKKIIDFLKNHPVVKRVDPLGSLRRKVSTVGDIDIAVVTKKPLQVVEVFCSMKEVKRVLAKGSAKASVILRNGCQVDLRVQEKESYGAQLQYFTGSKHHNIHLRRIANEKGFSLSEYGIARSKKGKIGGERIKIATEEEFYQILGMAYIPPELREDTGEIEAAQKGKLPKLVKLEDIKGDLHIHSNFPIEPSHDLGADSFLEIAQEARTLGCKYVGFADHSPAVGTHSKDEIKAIVEKRTKEIEQLKSSLNYIEVLNCLEVDILADGKLSAPDESLKILDLVIAGIHSSFRQSKEKMTKRVLSALSNPYVHILAHPTGRLLLEREGYEADWVTIYKFCAKNRKALEINAFPTRLDLPDAMVREAKKYGAKFVVNTDSHRCKQIESLRYGVAVARRGWCEKEDILNTLPLEKLLKWFKR